MLTPEEDACTRWLRPRVSNAFSARFSQDLSGSRLVWHSLNPLRSAHHLDLKIWSHGVIYL